MGAVRAEATEAGTEKGKWGERTEASVEGERETEVVLVAGAEGRAVGTTGPAEGTTEAVRVEATEAGMVRGTTGVVRAEAMEAGMEEGKWEERTGAFVEGESPARRRGVQIVRHRRSTR
jgi:hypothetical protein